MLAGRGETDAAQLGRMGSWPLPAVLSGAPAAAQEEGDVAGQGQPEVVRPLVPIPPERLDQMVPKHPGYLGALAPENIARPRPAAAVRRDRHLVRRPVQGLRGLHVRAALPEVLRARAARR